MSTYAQYNPTGSGSSDLTFTDSLVNSSGTVTLSGDTASPGNNQYYGTNGSGTLGYYNLTSGTAIACRYTGSTTTISSTPSAVSFSTQDYDTNSAYSGSTFTVPVSGKYQINASLNFENTAFGGNQAVDIYIYRNGASVSQRSQNTFTTQHNQQLDINDILNLSSGDTIQIFADCSQSGTSITSLSVQNVLAIAFLGM